MNNHSGAQALFLLAFLLTSLSLNWHGIIALFFLQVSRILRRVALYALLVAEWFIGLEKERINKL